MIASPSRATDASMCSFGACCEHAGYECGTHTVGRPSTSAKQSFGSEPPRFGRIAGARRSSPRSTRATRVTHGCAGSSRVACMISGARRARRRRCAKPCASRCARSAGTNVVGIAAHDEAKLQVRRRARRNRVHRDARIAGDEREHLERVPREHALGRREARLAPARVDRRTAGLAGLDVGERRAHRRGDRRRAQRRRRGCARARRPSTRSRARGSFPDWRAARPSCPSGGRRSRRSTVEVEVERAARAEEQRRLRGAQARAVGGDQHVGGKRLALALRRRRAARRAGLLAGLEQDLDVEAQPSARFEHALERREVDRVLALVVRGAAAVPAVAFARERPRRQALAPLRVVAQDRRRRGRR